MAHTGSLQVTWHQALVTVWRIGRSGATFRGERGVLGGDRALEHASVAEVGGWPA